MDLPIRLLDSGLPMPAYAHEGDAGLDLFAAHDTCIEPGERVLIGTGVAVAIPEGYAGFVQPRSGLALRSGLSFVNTPGLIDSHYRGEIKLIAVNLDPVDSIRVTRGQKVAQLVVQPVVRVVPVQVTALDPTTRGEGGFGSTGT
ncbi:MAG: dUTP diphosphatase [Coriobacteriia bacterium]|nr:dUTP diphosphatase [Coriobacteriia bacterium]